MEKEKEVKAVVEQNGIYAILNSIPGVAWLFIIVGAKMLIDEYVPVEYAQWATFVTLALLAVGKAVGVSQEQVIALLGLISDKETPKLPEGVLMDSAGDSQGIPVKTVKHNKFKRFLF